MMILGLHWRETYGVGRLSIYGFLYLLSLSTVLFWVFVPFDLLLANMVLVQLPCVILTRTTLHGFLSGGVTTVRSQGGDA
jgi:hypothetical protein